MLLRTACKETPGVSLRQPQLSEPLERDESQDCNVGDHGASSIMLPQVMRYNLPHTAPQQARIAAALGRADGDAAAAVADLIAELGQPGRLRDLKVEPAQFAKIAEGAMENLWVRTNPRQIRGPEDIIGLLEAAW